MPTESQNIEFKESWRDEYQKWICGFANAQGGVLYIGIKVRCAGCQETDGRYSEQGARHDGHLGRSQFERKG